MAHKQSVSKKSDAMKDILFASSPMGICIFSDEKIRMSNSRFLDFFAPGKDQLTGKSLSDLFTDPGDQKKIRDLTSFSIEKDRDGEKEAINLQVQPAEYIFDNGKPGIILYVQELLQKEPKTEIQEVRSSTLTAFNLSPSLILLLDKKTNILNINDTALQLVERSKDEAVGLQPGNVLKCIRSYDNEDGCGHGPMCKKCLIRNTVQSTLKTGKNHIKVESPFAFKHGESRIELTIELSSIAYDHEGERNVLVCIDDITQRKNLENQLRSSEEELQRKNYELKSLNLKLMDSYNKIKQVNSELTISKEHAIESDQLKSAFLANLSHEIRTPLNGMLGFIDLLNTIDPSSDQGIKYASIIHQNAEQLLHIVNDVLDISLIETGQMKLDPKHLDLNTLLNSILDEYKEVATRQGIEFELNLGCPEEKCQVWADPKRLKQILDKLIDNAFKFTNSGNIEVGYKLIKTGQEFFVKDTGSGIDKTLHRKIFERFRQADNTDTRLYGGLGLGLPIAKELIELHGGEIWLESSPGEGASFHFSIPNELQSSKKKEQFNKIRSAGLFEQRTVLIVEDEEYNMLFLQELMRRSGANILTAGNGQEAIELCETHPEIDLVLMDLKMPQVDGITATRRIRQHRKDLPIIAHTAYVLGNAREKALEAGCDDYIAKPAGKQEMMELVSKYL